MAESENSLGETQVAHLDGLARVMMGLKGAGGQASKELARESRGPTIPDSMGQDKSSQHETTTDAPIMKPTLSASPPTSSTKASRPSTSSPKKGPPRFASSASAPQATMEAMVENATPTTGVPKAASFAAHPTAYPNGDTQSQDSQVYHDYRASMRREAESSTTPLRRSRPASPNTSNTLATDGAGEVDRTPRTLQQQESGYVDLEGFLQDREVSPVNSTQGFEELLDEEENDSPETQMHAPPAKKTSEGGLPQTPASGLAGNKHGREGELLTSVTTGPKFSQLFPKADLMGQSQAFHQTQEVSSPFPSGPPSDPAMTRPSPNHVASSPTRVFSSPMQTRISTRPTSAVSEPRGEYTSMRESQDRRAARLRAELENRDVSESESEDDTQTRRFRNRQMRRALSEQAMRATANVKVMRPSYLSSGTKSAKKSEGQQPIDLVTPGTVGRVRWDLELIEDEEDEMQVELPVGGEDRGDHGDEEDAGMEVDGDDEYDELQQTVLRSQSNFQEEDDEQDGSVVEARDGDAEVEDDELEDTQHPDDVAEDESMDHDAQDGPTATQRSTIADSQPTGQEMQRSTSQQVHHSSMASFIPGSQYTGKTSEELAFLRSSRPSQARVPASPLAINESEQKLPSSPPLPAASVEDNSDEASLARQDLLKQFQCDQQKSTEDSTIATTQQEIPESDLPEQQASETPQGAKGGANADEESQNRLLYSTARTHVSASASAVSPHKPSQAPSLLRQGSSYSPMKAFRHPNSQQSRLHPQQSQMSPRQAVGVRRFGDVLSRGGAGSVLGSFEDDEVDVEGIMEGVMTTEDRVHLRTMASPKKSQGARRSRRGVNSDVEMKDVRDDPPQQSNAPSEMQDMTIPESEQGLAQPPPPMEVRENEVLRDSPSKANELPTPPPADDEEKGRSPTPDSAVQRQREGERHVSQLISQRGPPPGKKQKLTTYSRAGKRGKGKSGKRGGKSKRDMTDDEEGQDEVEETVDDGKRDERRDEVVDEVNRADAMPPPAERVHDGKAVAQAEKAEQEAEKDQADRGEAAKELDDAAAVGAKTDSAAPNRIWALFKGTYNHFYPATYLSSSLDGQRYKVRFDDTTVTDIETQHVRRLELQVGDLVRVDNKGMRKLTYRVVGHGTLAATKEEVALGTDCQGHGLVKVVAKASRASTAGEDTSIVDDDGESQDVPINQLYLTHSMWKAFKDRTFIPPHHLAGVTTTRGRQSRLTTPSEGVPTEDNTPTRSLGGAAHPTIRNKTSTSHLRDLSLASSNTSSVAGIGSPTQLFANMAFAITYLSSSTSEKATVIAAIHRHGGTILEDGFAELFDIPDLSTSTTDGVPPQTLRLKPQFEHLKLVALIADRHSRRAKYMQALALGLPTLSGRWVLDSLDPVRNTSLSNTGPVSSSVLPWEKYSLPAGESSYLSGAIRSRSMLPPSSGTIEGTFKDMVDARPRLLRDEGVLIVAPPPPASVSSAGNATAGRKEKENNNAWERTKTFVFLTLAIGAGRVRRVGSLSDVAPLVKDGEWGWVYVGGDVEGGYSSIVAPSTSSSGARGRTAGKKRKRAVDDTGLEDGAGEKKLIRDGCSGKVLGVDGGRVRVVGDEFVIQSLILGGLVD